MMNNFLVCATLKWDASPTNLGVANQKKDIQNDKGLEGNPCFKDVPA